MSPEIQRQPPPYLQIADYFRDQIRRGELANGDFLPPVREIATQWQVAHSTAAKVLAVLSADGLVRTFPGSGGTMVSTGLRIRRHATQRLSREQWGRGSAIQDADTGNRPRAVNVIVDEVTAPSHVGDALQIPEGAVVLRRARLFSVDDRPVQLASSYLSLDVVTGSRIADVDTGPGGTYARLAELGQAPVRFTETLRVRTPTREEARQLALPSGTSIIAITRCAFTTLQRCIEVTDMVLDAAAYELIYDIDA